MTYQEATAIYGTLIRPKDAADILEVKQPCINDRWKRGTLSKIKVMFGEVEKTFIPLTEINKLLIERKSKQLKK